MKRKRPHRIKKIAKKLFSFGKKVKNTVDVARNPLDYATNSLLERGSQIDTRTEQHGAFKNRRQYYNPLTKRFVKKNTKNGQFMGSNSVRGKKYKHIPIGSSLSKTSKKSSISRKKQNSQRKKKSGE